MELVRSTDFRIFYSDFEKIIGKIREQSQRQQSFPPHLLDTIFFILFRKSSDSYRNEVTNAQKIVSPIDNHSKVSNCIENRLQTNIPYSFTTTLIPSL
jgi:hypothetical protein